MRSTKRGGCIWARSTTPAIFGVLVTTNASLLLHFPQVFIPPLRNWAKVRHDGGVHVLLTQWIHSLSPNRHPELHIFWLSYEILHQWVFKIKTKAHCAYQGWWVWQRRCPLQPCCGQRRCRNLSLGELPTWSAVSGCRPHSQQSEQHTTPCYMNNAILHKQYTGS